MSKKLIITLAAILSLSSFAFVDIADAKPKGKQAEQTALTAEQEAQLQQMTIAHIQALQPVQANLASKEAAYQAVMLNQNPNPEQAALLAGEISTLRHDLINKSIAYHEKIAKDFGLNFNNYAYANMACPAPTQRTSGKGAK